VWLASLRNGLRRFLPTQVRVAILVSTRERRPFMASDQFVIDGICHPCNFWNHTGN
jgi:hypothetical protein